MCEGCITGFIRVTARARAACRPKTGKPGRDALQEVLQRKLGDWVQAKSSAERFVSPVSRTWALRPSPHSPPYLQVAIQATDRDLSRSFPYSSDACSLSIPSVFSQYSLIP
jgi:hypothetical protein